MMQEAYSQVVRAYREQHLAKDKGFTEPEDHIAVELAFMATLAERTAAFLREGHEEAAEETVAQPGRVCEIAPVELGGHVLHRPGRRGQGHFLRASGRLHEGVRSGGRVPAGRNRGLTCACNRFLCRLPAGSSRRPRP